MSRKKELLLSAGVALPLVIATALLANLHGAHWYEELAFLIASPGLLLVDAIWWGEQGDHAFVALASALNLGLYTGIVYAAIRGWRAR